MFQRLLVCTDLSDGLYRLAGVVSSLAKGGVQQVVFLHTLTFADDREIPRVDPEDIQAVRDRLSAMLEPNHAGVEVRIEVCPGKPIDLIQQTAQSYQSEVVVLGMPTRSLLNERLFGSTTMGLCQRSTLPILTLRPQLIATYTGEELALRCQHLCRYLLIPYDGSEAADYLVERVKFYAQKRPAHSLEQCLLCWVFEEVNPRSLPRNYTPEMAQTKIETVQTELEALGLIVTTKIRYGNPLTELMQVAMESDISAIALSSDNLGKWLSWSVPSFAEEMLRRCWHPILYLPFR